MKKILLGTATALFIANANADVDNEDYCCDEETSFSGIFVGAGVTVSGDHSKIESDVYQSGHRIPFPDNHYSMKSKHMTNVGATIVLEYGQELGNGFWLGLNHESSFLTKENCEYENIFNLPAAFQANYRTLTVTRKFYSPSFGLSIGYIVGNWNFGVRNGLSIDRFEIKRGAIGTYPLTVINTARVSYCLGVFITRKINKFFVFADIAYKFSRDKEYTAYDDDRSQYQEITFKIPSWKFSFGVKCNVKNIVNQFH